MREVQRIRCSVKSEMQAIFLLSLRCSASGIHEESTGGNRARYEPNAIKQTNLMFIPSRHLIPLLERTTRSLLTFEIMRYEPKISDAPIHDPIT